MEEADVKFLALTLIDYAPHPITGELISPAKRFGQVVDNAALAEELGFDGYAVGERHERPFLSSSPPVVLSHIAAKTSRIALFTGVTTLSLLDPVRAYEDYATLDNLSGGRLQLIDYYRERWAHYGHDPADAVIGAGSAGLYVAPNSQDAIDTYRPLYEARLRIQRELGLPIVFPTLEDAIERSSLLVGSPQQVVDKILRYHNRFGHEVMHAAADAGGLSADQHRESLALFQSDVAPAVRAAAPSRPLSAHTWQDQPIGHIA